MYDIFNSLVSFEIPSKDLEQTTVPDHDEFPIPEIYLCTPARFNTFPIASELESPFLDVTCYFCVQGIRILSEFCRFL